MGEIIFYTLLLGLAIASGLAVSLGLVGGLNLATRVRDSYIRYVVSVMLFLTGVGILFSGRNVDLVYLSMSGLENVAVNPIVAWLRRGATVFLVFISIERIVRYSRSMERLTFSLCILLSSYVVFWVCTVAITSLWSAHPTFSHEYFYTLVIGVAILLMSASESKLALTVSRSSILFFMVISFLLIPIMPKLVIDMSYSQGVINGIPRLHGLAPHAITLAMLALVEIVILLANPFSSPRMNNFALFMSALTLFLAQSKTAWVSFFVCLICLMAVRHGASFMRRFVDYARPTFGIGVVIAAMLFIILSASVIMFGGVEQKISQLLASDEGNRLMSMTGRDQIWRVALEEWYRNPVLGYGHGLFDIDFRSMINMSFAVHAHNQFVDTLSRSGVVGAMGLVLYFIVICVLSIRYARSSGGLTLGLCAILAVRSITEIPLTLVGYGPEFVLHSLLLISLVGEARNSSVSTKIDNSALVSG